MKLFNSGTEREIYNSVNKRHYLVDYEANASYTGDGNFDVENIFIHTITNPENQTYNYLDKKNSDSIKQLFDEIEIVLSEKLEKDCVHLKDSTLWGKITPYIWNEE